MKTQIFILIVGVISLVGNVQGVLIWDSGDHVFSEGSEDFIEMYNDATATISGGEIWEFYMYDFSSASFSGGNVMQILADDLSSVTVQDSSVIDFLKPLGSSKISLNGGFVNILSSRELSKTSIYGGSLNIIDALGSSEIIIYAKSYEYIPGGGQFGDGLLTGIWLYGNDSFTIELLGSETINHITIVPEPMTLVVFFIGGGFLFRSKKLSMSNK